MVFLSALSNILLIQLPNYYKLIIEDEIEEIILLELKLTALSTLYPSRHSGGLREETARLGCGFFSLA